MFIFCTSGLVLRVFIQNISLNVRLRNQAYYPLHTIGRFCYTVEYARCVPMRPFEAYIPSIHGFIPKPMENLSWRR